MDGSSISSLVPGSIDTHTHTHTHLSFYPTIRYGQSLPTEKQTRALARGQDWQSPLVFTRNATNPIHSHLCLLCSLTGFGIAVAISIVISFLIGIATFFVVKGQSVNFFVAGRSLPLWIVSMTLAAQSIDSNAILGNADLSYKFGFYDGAVIPIGLGLSLILNGIFLAHHVNNDEVLTLPDIFAKRYGKVVEILVSLTTICSFLMLLAGNLVGFGAITSYVWGISDTAAIWIAAGIVWVYTASGGLFSVAYTDVVQGLMGWSGCIVMAFWFIANEEPNAPPPSIGYPRT
jgi:Na+/proline symporter